MANTNAFSMRRKNEALWAKYRTVLDKLAESSSKKQTAYEEYLVRLNEVLPRNEKSALSAEILASMLSSNEEERASICQSIAAFASNADTRRTNADSRRTIMKLHSEDWEFNVTFPDLYRISVPVTHHYAELNEEGDVIRKWDTTSTETHYYLKKEG